MSQNSSNDLNQLVFLLNEVTRKSTELSMLVSKAASDIDHIAEDVKNIKVEQQSAMRERYELLQKVSQVAVGINNKLQGIDRDIVELRKVVDNNRIKVTDHEVTFKSIKHAGLIIKVSVGVVAAIAGWIVTHFKDVLFK